MIGDEASCVSIFDGLRQCEDKVQAGRAEQQGAGDLLNGAEGSVASEAAMPIVDLFSVRGRYTTALQFTRVVWTLLRARQQLKMQFHRLWQQVTQPSHNI
jgi:hypothetical protein